MNRNMVHSDCSDRDSSDDEEDGLAALVLKTSNLRLQGISSLRRTRGYFDGSNTPINDLPNELLLKILEYLNVSVASERSLDAHGPEIPPCTYPSQVCRRWRQIALSSSHLWASVIGPTRAWTVQSLLRCRWSTPVALYVESCYLESGRSNYRDAVQLAMIRLCVASKLHVHLRSPDDTARDPDIFLWTMRLADLLSHSAPHLEEVSIKCDGFSSLPLVELVFSSFEVASPPFAKVASACLQNCTLSPSSRVFSQCLTELSLQHTVVWEDVEQMIQFFRSVPLLSSFMYELGYSSQLSGGFSDAVSGVLRPRCVPMPHLRSLHLSSAFSQSAAMLTYLALPSNAQMTIQDHFFLEAGDIYHIEVEEAWSYMLRVLRAMNNHCFAAQPLAYASTRAELLPNMHVETTMWPSCSSAGSDAMARGSLIWKQPKHLSHRPPLQIGMTFAGFARAVQRVDQLEIADIHVLAANHLGRQFFDLAKESTASEIILKRTDDVPAFIELFSNRPGEQDIAFPKLRTLALKDVRLEYLHMQPLMDLLVRRISKSEASSALSLHLRNCNVPLAVHILLNKILKSTPNFAVSCDHASAAPHRSPLKRSYSDAGLGDPQRVGYPLRWGGLWLIPSDYCDSDYCDSDAEAVDEAGSE
ncbi:hypothetical protein PENSPDRAFT_755511 [Peniophora sp. CONT]|nr:hypothetical protein PENSPDRAFT_755511 [Peniophora sp. CONT]